MNSFKIVTLFTLLFSASHLFSQSTNEIDWAWANTYGNQSNSVANQVVVDDNFDIYVSGTFDDTLLIDGDTLVSPGYEVVFLAKFDQFGDRIWATSIDNSFTVQKIALDTNNDVHLLLNYNQILTYSGANGAFLNAHSLATNPPIMEGFIDFELDTDLNTYLLSYFYPTPGTGIQFCRIDKFDNLNSSLWSKSFEISIGIGGSVNSISLDSNNNVYFSGTTSGGYQMSIVGTDIVSVSGVNSPGDKLFIAKFNDVGEAQWLDTLKVNFVEAIGAEVNSADNSMYITGYHIAQEVFYNDTLNMDTTNYEQIYLMKYDLDGNYAWTKSYPLATKSLKTYSGASWGALGTHLSIADNGNVYLKGSFTGSIIFSNDTLVEDTTTVVLGMIADDSFIAKLDANGNPIWGKYGGNSGGYGNETGGFWVDSENDVIYMVGYYAAPNNLIRSSKMMTPTNSVKQIFVGKEDGPIHTASVQQITNEEHQVLVYPNPSSGVYFISKSNRLKQLAYSIVDLRGNVISTGMIVNNVEKVDISELNDGIYFFQTEIGSIKLLKQ